MKVTYLLGAGASSECLPTYQNFRTRFSGFLTLVSNESRGKPDNAFLSDMKRILEEINKEFIFHSTPDTIAKKYFHLNDRHRQDLIKRSLILFFLYHQISSKPIWDSGNTIVKDVVDKRYDSFVAGLLKPIPNKQELIENINILTWNYDLQFEIAFSKYMNKSLSEIQDHIQSFPKILSQDQTYLKHKFSLIHLNGIAYARPDIPINTDMIGEFIFEDSEIIIYLSEVYKALNTTNTLRDVGGNKLLTFAWEKLNTDYSLTHSPHLDHAMKIAESTQILVINGYSFPIFNRPIDQKLFEKMSNLEKIYIQSPQAKELEKIIKGDMLENNVGVEFIDLGYWNQFYIPSEWSKKKGKDFFPITFK